MLMPKSGFNITFRMLIRYYHTILKLKISNECLQYMNLTQKIQLE